MMEFAALYLLDKLIALAIAAVVIIPLNGIYIYMKNCLRDCDSISHFDDLGTEEEPQHKLDHIDNRKRKK